MNGTDNVDYGLLRDLLRPADSVLALGLIALRQEARERLEQRWQELGTNWQTYEKRLLGRLPFALEQDFRSTVTLARLFIALSLQEEGQTIPKITGLFSVKEVYLGRLLAGAETLEVFTPEELKKEALRNSELRQLLADMADNQQQGIGGLLDPGSQIRKDLVAAFKGKYASRLTKLEELARLYHSELVEQQIKQTGAGTVLQAVPTQPTPQTQRTQTTPPTINISGNVDGPIIIKQEIKAEAEIDKGQDTTKGGSSTMIQLIINFTTGVFFRSWGIAFFSGSTGFLIASFKVDNSIRIWFWTAAFILIIFTIHFLIRDYHSWKTQVKQR